MTTTETERRKPGRPRSGGRINCTIRVTPQRYADIKGAADEHGRSFSEEVEARLERSILVDFELKLGKVFEEQASIGMELLDKATAQLADLRQERDLLHKALASLEAERYLLDHRLGEIVEEAVIRVFAKTGRRL